MSSEPTNAARRPRYRTITFKQRRFWMPWRVEWITQAWSDQLGWVVISRVPVKP